MENWKESLKDLSSCKTGSDTYSYEDIVEFITSLLEVEFEKGKIAGRLEALPITIEEVRNAKIKLLEIIISKYKKMGSSAGDYAMVYVEEELSKLNK